jgi:hypothetical protein
MHATSPDVQAQVPEPHNRWRRVSICASLFGPPVAWALQLMVVYALVPWACRHHRTYLLHVMTVVFLVMSLTSGVLAHRHWREVGGGWPTGTEGDPDTRTRFISVLGMLASALFTLVILAQWVPAFVFDPCQD